MIYYKNLQINKLFDKIYPVSKRKKNAEYNFECDNIVCFDIETSQMWLNENGELIPYHKGEPDDYWNEKEIYTLPYIWQMAIDDTVIYGREITEISGIIEQFPQNTHIIIYVHNLAFEFIHLLNCWQWGKVFARQNLHPITAIPKPYPNIEFRCSYILTHMSLKEWGASLGFEKLEMDYFEIRTPNTKLSETVLDYSERDVQVMVKGLRVKLETYKHIYNIPLTQTGQVRRVVRNRMLKDENGKSSNALCKRISNMLPSTAEEYQRLRKTFRGGDSHSNFLFTGQPIKTLDGKYVKMFNFDFTSSYPFVMCSEKFPMTAFTECIFDIEKIDKYAYLMEIELFDVKPKPEIPHHYLSFHKCETKRKYKLNKTKGKYKLNKPKGKYKLNKKQKRKIYKLNKNKKKKYKLNNGRIYSCEYCKTWITEQDYTILKECYTIEKENIIQCYRSRKAYLPKQLIEYILELYGNKTQLKGTKDILEKKLYDLSKEYINSLYGMTVTDLIFDEIIYKGGVIWDDKSGKKSIEEIENYLIKIHENAVFPKPFLNYAWGIWVTAYGRRNLWTCLLKGDNPMYCVYVDTDSLKMTKKVAFGWYNKICDFKLKMMCNHYSIDFEKTRPKDRKGIPHPLGYAEQEDSYIEFCTLGAKRYCYRTEDGKLHITVAGINKGAVECLNNDIENFNYDLVFDKDNDSVTKKLSVYTDTMKPIIWKRGEKDEYFSELKYGVLLRPVSYSMSIESMYAELLKWTDGNRLAILETLNLDEK